MIFYVVLFFVCIGLLFIGKQKRYARASFLILWAVYAFRDKVGVDDGNYISAFDYVGKGWTYDIEWTYKILAKFAQNNGLNYKFIFLVYGSIALIMLYKAVDILFDTNRRKAVYLACFFGTVFVSSVSVMRQFTAAAICFYAVAYMYKYEILRKPIVLCLIASLFHGGAILAIPFLFLIRPQVKVGYSLKMGIAIFATFCGYLNISGLLLNKLMRFLPVSYQIYQNAISGSFSSAGGAVSLLMLVLFLTQCAISKRAGKIEPQSKMDAVMEKGQLLYLGLLFFFVHAGVASRLAFTFLPFAATLPITFSNRIKREQKSIINTAIVVCMFFLYIMAIQSTAAAYKGTFIPYNASFDFWK